MKTVVRVLVVCGTLVVAGCGQKGPLYLPDKNASVVTRPAGSNNPASTEPAAAPSQQPQDKDKNDDDSQSSKPKS